MIMKLKYVFYIFFILLVNYLISPAYALKEKVHDPVLNPIKGLTITTTLGQMIIKNSSGENISVTSMLLTFTLNQSDISGVWGTPWLNWQAQTNSFHQSLQAKSYQFVNQENLPDNTFSAGSSIVIQY